MGIKRYVVQNGLIRLVAEINVFKYDVAAKLGVGRGVVVFMVMLPRPDVGSLRNLRKRAVGSFGHVNESYIAVVLFRLLVK